MDEIIALNGSTATDHPVPQPAAPIDDGLNDESLRRVQACLIACEGISTEDLEGGIIQEMRQTLRDVIPLLQGLRRNCA